MSTADTWMDEKSTVGGDRDREPVEVVVSRIILAIGMSVAMAVVVMSVIWSSSPSGSREAEASAHSAPWRPSHGFRAVARAATASDLQVNHTGAGASANHAQSRSA